jgi:hypothetical protein
MKKIGWSVKKTGAAMVVFATLLSICSALIFVESQKLNMAIMFGGVAVANACLAFVIIKYKILGKHKCNTNKQ